MIMNKIIIYISFFFFATLHLQAQELNAKLTVNSSKIAGSDKTVFTTLQTALEQLVNGTKWTEATFSSIEKIDCTFSIIINSMSDNSFSGEIQVTASRPVYNASYITPTFNYRDQDFTFTYTEGETLEYTPNSISSNLIAVISYYSYVIIGLDYDSLAPNGGSPYFLTAMQIVNGAQSLGTKGWAAFENDRNRHALALALTEESMKPFHELWYQYHRLGLDDMTSNVSRGKSQIASAIETLPKLKDVRTGNANVLFFGDTKLDEIVQIFGQSSSEEKQQLYKILNDLYPTKSSILEKLKR
jgi:hypothetical protein